MRPTRRRLAVVRPPGPRVVRVRALRRVLRVLRLVVRVLRVRLRMLAHHHHRHGPGAWLVGEAAGRRLASDELRLLVGSAAGEPHGVTSVVWR